MLLQLLKAALILNIVNKLFSKPRYNINSYKNIKGSKDNKNSKSKKGNTIGKKNSKNNRDIINIKSKGSYNRNSRNRD